ncbi:hypothetical protein HHI36_004301 [Cryptolaemus montrouzieri]|uniref:Uncharacterized protein n=1 Tax=Cryptolaemus montrouzieri TaxID=559131 RepID=A0ABD2NQS2_9CUCU
MNVKQFKKLFQLCEDYQKITCTTPTEYLNEQNHSLDEDVIFHFLNFYRHDKVFQEISDHFIEYNSIVINMNGTRIKLLFYLLIFIFNPPNTTRIEQIFLTVSKISYMTKILLYYSDKSNQIRTAKSACKYFENEYVINNFVYPILNNEEYYRNVFDFLTEHHFRRHHKKLTIPIEMNVSKKAVKAPPVPVNTPAEIEPFRGGKFQEPHTRKIYVYRRN